MQLQVLLLGMTMFTQPTKPSIQMSKVAMKMKMTTNVVFVLKVVASFQSPDTLAKDTQRVISLENAQTSLRDSASIA